MNTTNIPEGYTLVRKRRKPRRRKPISVSPTFLIEWLQKTLEHHPESRVRRFEITVDHEYGYSKLESAFEDEPRDPLGGGE